MPRAAKLEREAGRATLRTWLQVFRAQSVQVLQAVKPLCFATSSLKLRLSASGDATATAQDKGCIPEGLGVLILALASGLPRLSCGC